MTINEYFEKMYREALNAETLEEATKKFDKAYKLENKVATMFADYEEMEEKDRGNTKFEKWCKKNKVKIEEPTTIMLNWLLDNDRVG